MIYKSIPNLKEYIWAGSKLKSKYHKESELNKISEAWELSLNDSGISSLLIDEKLVFFKDYALTHSLGHNLDNKEFRMLIKLIDSDDNLSIQVHPSDKYAIEHYQKFGKTEMWYIIESEKNAFIYLGFNADYTKEEVEKALNEGTIINLLNKIDVKPNDFFVIPSGTIHAIGKGVTLYEIQENSDLTFRLYDYDRVDKDGNKRELHIKEALDVLNYKKYDLESIKRSHKSGKVLTANDYFELMKIDINKSFNIVNDGNSFELITVIKGKPFINSIPALLGESYYVEPETKINIEGECSLLIARYPSLALGLDVGGTSVKGLIIDDLGQKISETKVSNDKEIDKDGLISNMEIAYHRLLSSATINEGYLKSIGVGFPGNIDSKTGEVLFSNNLGLRNAFIAHDLEQRIGIKVILENDANCAALGEYYFTDKKKYHDLTFLTLGTGVGSGFIIDSKLFKGGQGSMTEFGHTKIKSDYVECTCGQYGCIEALLGLSRIKMEVEKLKEKEETHLKELISDDESPVKIFSLADTNDAAKEFTKKYLNNLLIGLLNIANMIQPEIIVIGGGLSFHISKYLPSLEYRLNKYKYCGTEAPKIRLVQASLGNDAGAYGAAALTKTF